MNDRPAPGWIYVLTHPAWDGLGMVKIGRTGRNPCIRAAEITNVSGLLAPCKITCWGSPNIDTGGEIGGGSVKLAGAQRSASIVFSR
jgi:hypothetical protein